MQVGLKYLTAALTLSFSAIVGSASAADLALIISNGKYDVLSGERGISRNHDDLVEAFSAKGYEVIEGVDLSRLEMQALVHRVDGVMDQVQSIVVLTSSNIVTNGAQTWIMPTDIGGDSAIDAGFGAPTLDTFLALAARKPGHSAVFLGVADVNTSRGSDLRTGVGVTDIPQGVMLVSGPAGRVGSLLEDRLLRDSEPLAQALANPSGIVVAGYISPDHGLIAAEGTSSATTNDWVGFVAEQALWAVADKSNRRADFEEYLRRFPNGVYAQAARARLTPVAPVVVEPTPQEIEAALNLNRDSRREVQSNLTILGFDTRGVDGILGSGSRAAISSWQASQHFDATGYLTRDQITELQRLGVQRRALIEAEDRRYWNATGITGRKADLEQYLSKYPDGLFSTDANEALAVFEAEERTRLDNDAWSEAVDGGTANSYRRYLESFPNGIYATIAKQRIAALDPNSGNTTENALAKAQEDRLNLNVATRMLIENRLKSSGFNPGRVDGIFDENTRSAIKKYQKKRGMTATGYIDPATVRALLLG